MSKQFTVNFWGSNPDLGNDDCYTGEDYETLEEAMAVYQAPASEFSEVMSLTDCEYIQLVAPGCEVMRKNPEFVATSHDPLDDEWRREIAREEGMLGGIDAYNDHMGF